MTRQEELARYANISNMVDDLESIRVPRLQVLVDELKEKLYALDTCAPGAGTEYQLLVGQLKSIEQEISMTINEIRYLQATCKWIQDNIPNQH